MFQVNLIMAQSFLIDFKLIKLVYGPFKQIKGERAILLSNYMLAYHVMIDIHLPKNSRSLSSSFLYLNNACEGGDIKVEGRLFLYGQWLPVILF